MGKPKSGGSTEEQEVKLGDDQMKERLTEEQECPDKEGRDEVDGLEGVGEEHPG